MICPLTIAELKKLIKNKDLRVVQVLILHVDLILKTFNRVATGF